MAENKKIIGTGNFIFLLLTIFLVAIISSKPILALELHVEFDEQKNIKKILPYEENLFYREEFYMGGNSKASLNVFLYDSEDNLISAKKMKEDSSVIFDLDDVIHTGTKFYIATGQYSFSVKETEKNEIILCNNDGFCDSCPGGGCSIVESSASCSDCTTGSEDGFCDLEEDGICDPDCEGKDMDCENCTAEDCLTKQIEEDNVLCKDLGGMGCTVYEVCDGENIYSDDFGTRCCKGTCVDENSEDYDRLMEEYDEEAEDRLDKSLVEYDQRYDMPTEDDVDNSDIILVLLLILSVILLIVSGAYFLHREYKEHFNNPIVRYIDNLFKKGYTKEQIVPFMQQYGYKPEDLEKVFRVLKR